MTTDFKVAEVQLSYRNTVPYKKRTQITNAKEAYKVLLKIHNDDTIDYTESFRVIYLNQSNHVLGSCKALAILVALLDFFNKFHWDNLASLVVLCIYCKYLGFQCPVLVNL